MKNLENKQSNEKTNETEKTIKEIQSCLSLDGTSFDCGCYCCLHRNRRSEHIHMFLQKLMIFEDEKIKQPANSFLTKRKRKHATTTFNSTLKKNELFDVNRLY